MQRPAELLEDAVISHSEIWPAPLRFLSKLSEFRQTAAIVLLVSAPLWLYSIIAAGVTLTVGEEVSYANVIKFAAGRLLLFPILFGTYLLAMRIKAKPSRALRFWSKQLLIAAAFLILMYPLLLILNSWAFSVPVPIQDNFLVEAIRGHFQNALAPFRLWELWVATSLELSEVYLLGLALMLALNSFLRYRAAQSLTAELHAKWLEAQLATLRDQIGPHFLFNALNTILASIRDEPEMAEKMTIELGTLLRHNLDRGDQEFTSVEDEIMFVERYLAIMKMRFEERLQISIQLEPEVRQYRMPAFLFLPLVENAIKHGVARVPGRSSIEIQGSRAGDRLSFRFENSTDGAPGAEAGAGHRAIGLENTRARIQSLYGAEGSFSAGFETPGRWVTHVTIPAQRP
jgi:hypothetical protein